MKKKNFNGWEILFWSLTLSLCTLYSGWKLGRDFPRPLTKDEELKIISEYQAPAGTWSLLENFHGDDKLKPKDRIIINLQTMGLWWSFEVWNPYSLKFDTFYSSDDAKAALEKSKKYCGNKAD